MIGLFRCKWLDWFNRHSTAHGCSWLPSILSKYFCLRHFKKWKMSIYCFCLFGCWAISFPKSWGSLSFCANVQAPLSKCHSTSGAYIDLMGDHPYSQPMMPSQLCLAYLWWQEVSSSCYRKGLTQWNFHHPFVTIKEQQPYQFIVVIVVSRRSFPSFHFSTRSHLHVRLWSSLADQ